MIKLQDLQIPLTVVTNGAKLICVEVSPSYAYEGGKRTDTQIGFRYTVVETRKFEKFYVKVNLLTTTITQEQLDTAKERVYVSFENAVAKPYRTSAGDYELSITATNVSLVK